jgi:high-affinity iron transporter
LISSFLIALREGLEAALIIGIVLVSLGRSGRSHLVRFVWTGVGLAVALSFAAAVALEEWKINQEAFEGVLLLSSAVFVVTMIGWMNRAAKNLKKNIEKRVETYGDRAGLGAGLGLGAFVFLMVLREGAELALILRAVELSSQGAFVWVGTLLGLGGAVAVGLLFFQGTLRIPLGRFFKVTSWILVIVAVQLALTGVHELSEARWLPSSTTEMAFVGPVVRNDIFFFAAILGVAALLVLREWLALPDAAAEAGAGSEAERRRLAGERRKQGRWLIAAGTTFLIVTLILTADFLYARTAAAPPDVQTLSAEAGVVRVPTAGLGDGSLHFFRADLGGTLESFMVIRQPSGNWVAAIDGCMICGRHGYRQEGSNVICRNCAAMIAISTLGQVGGCNPVAVPLRLEGGDLVLQAADLSRAVLVPQ